MARKIKKEIVSNQAKVVVDDAIKEKKTQMQRADSMIRANLEKGMINPNLSQLKQYLSTVGSNGNLENPNNIATSIPSLWNYMTSCIILNPDPVSLSTYQRIAREDYKVRGCLEKITQFMVSGIGDYHHKNPKVQKLVRYALNHITGGLNQLAGKLIGSAGVSGFYVGEMIPDVVFNENGEPVTVVKDVISLPPQSVLLTVDYAGRIADFFQWWTNSGLPSYQNSSLGGNLGTMLPAFTTFVDPMSYRGAYDYPVRTPTTQFIGLNILPKDYIIHFTFGGITDTNNTYGQSWLQPIYSLWLQRNAVIDIELPGLQQRLRPLIVAYTDPNRQVDIDGNKVNLVDKLYQELSEGTGSGAIIIQGRKDESASLGVLETSAEFSYIHTKYQDIDRAIATCLNVPESSEGSSSYASAYQQDSEFSRVYNARREELQYCILNTIVKFILERNLYPSEYGEDLGYFEKNTQSLDDQLKTINIAKLAKEANFINDGRDTESKDCNIIRSRLNLDPTDKPINNEDSTNVNNIRNVNDMTNSPYAHDKKKVEK